MRIILSGLTVLLLLSQTSLQAEIYRWTDESGKVHFSDRPVSDKAKQVQIKVTPVTRPDPQQTQDRKLRTEQFLRAREEERAEKNKAIAKKKRQKKIRKRNCVAAKKEYNRLSRSRSIYFKGENGERNFIGDDERTRVLARAKADIKKWCK